MSAAAPPPPVDAAPASGTDGYAITSLVASIVGLVIPLLPSIVGVVFGHLALGRIKQSGQGGRGLAIAGLAVGYVSIALTVLVLLVFVAFGVGSSEPGGAVG